METEALRKALCFLEGQVSISEVVTDASRTVMGLLGEIIPFSTGVQKQYLLLLMIITAREFPQYFHSLDVWHKSKKLKKCLAEVRTMHKNYT